MSVTIMAAGVRFVEERHQLVSIVDLSRKNVFDIGQTRRTNPSPLQRSLLMPCCARQHAIRQYENRSAVEPPCAEIERLNVKFA
ncbi:hypothetical protein KX816_14030 [Sphingosinicellaceae bacterium]|nr:hypothetical protein KX816_14030 [Sphingosinicellaceae bacterium]